LTIAAVAALLLPAAGLAQTSERPASAITVLPALASAPETGLTYGVVMQLVTRPTGDSITRPTRYEVLAVRTTKSQWRVAAEGDAWFAQNDWRVSGRIEYRVFPLSYYGIGIDAPESSKETFTPKGLNGFVQVQRKLAPEWYAIGGVKFWDQTITIAPLGPLALSGYIGSLRSIVWQGGVAYDSRDDVFAPSRGALVQLTEGVSTTALGSDLGYTRTVFDARVYRQVHPRVVAAAQVVTDIGTGTPPFDQLGMMGSSSIARGYELGRYRDRHFAGTQGELRVQVHPRVALAGYVGMATVSPTLSDFTSVRWLPTVGGGMRFSLFKAVIRGDLALGHHAKGIYIGFNQAF
jgi:hypothetical protein